MPESSPTPLIESRIYFIRGHKVLLDQDLALLHQVPAKGEAVVGIYLRFY
jgi:hypothetical protein